MASAQTATFDIVYAQNRLISMLFLLVVQTGTRHLYKMDCLGTTTVLAKDDKNSETARFRLSA